MSGPELQITQLPAGNLSLVQVEVSHGVQLSSLADRLRGIGASGQASEPGPRACALGPTEWLLKDVSRHRIRRTLCEFERILSRVTDVSASYALYRMAGPAARTLLDAKLRRRCQAAGGGSGHYARTRLGPIEVILEPVAVDCFLLYVDWRLCPALEAWLRSRWDTCFLEGQRTLQ
jgi:sarcosine oxidase gamma subunit